MLRQESPDAEKTPKKPFDESLERGEFEPLRRWLTEHLYALGRKFTPEETIERVTGSTIDARPYLRYLREKLAPQPA